MIFADAGAQDGMGRARPMDPGRDMRAVADLIETAFRGELDRTANSLVADMRQLASLGPLLTIADRVVPYPSGYVWELDGRVVGNATISPESLAAQRWFISNVAVHPDHQGRGIGCRLMEAALAGIRRQGGRQVLLQVRSDNEPAQRLYRRLDFRRFDTIVELLRSGPLPTGIASRLALRRLHSSDGQALMDLARAATPPEVLQVRPLKPRAFRPTLLERLRGLLDGLLGDQLTMRWGYIRDDALVAAISILASGGGTPARLDLTVRPEARGPIEGPLADAGLALLADWYPRGVAANVSASHPEALAAMRERHFMTVRSLDQLVLLLA
jgi:ribosomal protein S18 acetylase RimI-like enzyme